MTRYNKLGAAVMAAIASALVAQFVGGHMTQVGFVNVGLAGLSAVAVWAAVNHPVLSPYSKAIMAGLFAGAALLNTLVGAGSLAAVTGSEWAQVGIAVASAAAVYMVANATGAAPVARASVS